MPYAASACEDVNTIASLEVSEQKVNVTNDEYKDIVCEVVSNSGDVFIISGPVDGEIAVRKFLQLQYLFEATGGDEVIQDAWLDLSPEEMQTVIDIHA
jgi:exoribonuclease R